MPPSHFLKSHFNIILPSCSPIHATCPAHLILLDFITQKILVEEYRSLSSCYVVFTSRLLHCPSYTEIFSSPYSHHPILLTLFSSPYSSHPILITLFSSPYSHHPILLTLFSSPYSHHPILNTLFSNTLSLCSSLNVSDQVSHPYKKTGKIIIYIS